jgi:hypothetical protein
VYVRKINQAKWLQNDIKNGADVSADAITNCMKTSRNTLSLWRIADEAQIEEAVLAIVAGADHLDAIDVAVMPSQRLTEAGLTVVASPGNTTVKSLVDTHADIQNLTYSSLGLVANCIVECFNENKVKRYTKGSLREILRRAIASGKLDRSSVPLLADQL